MKINDILDKVTLKFAGGGKLKLSDYGPYISNMGEEVKDLGGSASPVKDSPTPVAYFCMNAFKDENAMALYYLEQNLPNIFEPRIFTKDELKEYIESIEKIAFEYGFDDFDFVYSPFVFMTLYDSPDIKDQYLNCYIGYSGDLNAWHYAFTNKPILVNEELLENAPQSIIDIFETAWSSGYYVYMAGEENQAEPQQSIVNENNVDTYAEDYAVKVYFDSNISFELYIQDDILDGHTTTSSENSLTDDNGNYVLCPLGTYNIYFSNNDIRLSDSDGSVSGTSPFEYTFSKDKEYSIYENQN